MASGDLYRAKALDMAARARADTTRAGKAEYARLCLGYLRLAEQTDRRGQTDIVSEKIPAITQHVHGRHLLHRLLEHISPFSKGDRDYELLRGHRYGNQDLFMNIEYNGPEQGPFTLVLRGSRS